MGVGSLTLATLLFHDSTVAAHPVTFDPTTRHDDIGIITLPTPLVVSATIQTIALPPLSGGLPLVNLPYQNEEGFINGFGWTNTGGQQATTLQRAFQRVIDDEICTQNYIITPPNHFCARDAYANSNACLGDLGGGFIVRFRGVDTIFGITSITTHHCAHTNPTAYTRVSIHLPWIQSIITPPAPAP